MVVVLAIERQLAVAVVIRWQCFLEVLVKRWFQFLQLVLVMVAVAVFQQWLTVVMVEVACGVDCNGSGCLW